MAQAPQPYEPLWHADGNVILKTTSHLFRMHKSVLARESSVFRDMFAIPGPQDQEDGANGAQELYEGIPVVPMVDDDDDEILYLVRTIYENV